MKEQKKEEEIIEEKPVKGIYRGRHHEHDMKLIILLFILLALAFSGVFFYRHYYINGKLNGSTSNVNTNEQTQNGTATPTIPGSKPTNTTTTTNNTSNTGTNTTTPGTIAPAPNSPPSDNTNVIVSNKTNTEIITSYGSDVNDFANYVIESLKIYASMNILLNSPDGNIAAPKVSPQYITDNATIYKNKVLQAINSKDVITKIYIDQMKLKFLYNEPNLLAQLGLSSHSGAGLISMTSGDKNGITNYTFKTSFVNMNYKQTKYNVSDFKATQFTDNYNSTDAVIQQTTDNMLETDRQNIQSQITSIMDKIKADNHEELTIVGAPVYLNTNSMLQSVGSSVTNIIFIGQTSGNIYTIKNSDILSKVTIDSNLYWVIDPYTGLVFGYILKPGATAANPIAVLAGTHDEVSQ